MAPTVLRRAAALLCILAVAACADNPTQPAAPKQQASTMMPPIVAESQSFRFAGTTYLSYGGKRYAYPDEATLFACTGSFPGVVQDVTEMPALTDGGVLPSVLTHEWMSSAFPVKGSDGASVYVVVGCVKNPLPDLETLRAIFGASGAGDILTVAQSVVDQVPSGAVARAPLYAPGTLIKTSASAEVRWVSHMGGSLAIPSGEVLDSYCRFGVSRVPETLSTELMAYYQSKGSVEASSSNCAETQPPMVLDGEVFRIAGQTQNYIAYRGKMFGIPDAATLLACTGGFPSVLREIPRAPALRAGGMLPSATTNEFMTGRVAVSAPGGAGVYVVIGCARALIPDSETFFTIFGPSGSSSTATVTDAVMASVPNVGTARLPLRQPGTLIKKGSSPEIRWVTFVGGALAVPTTEILKTHCRTSVVSVSDAEFDAYPAKAYLETAIAQPCTSPPLTVLQADLRMPVPAGKAWRVVGQPNTGANVGVMRYSIDIDDTTEPLSGDPVRQDAVPLLAAADGTVYFIGRTPLYGKFIWLDHGGGLSTIYANVDSLSIVTTTIGQSVVRGQQIATMGNSRSDTSDVRLHFEVRYFEDGETNAAWLDQTVMEGKRVIDYTTGSYALSSNTPVLPAVAAVVLEQDSIRFSQIGADAYVYGKARAATGANLPQHVLTWRSTNTAVATVADRAYQTTTGVEVRGLVTAAGVGQAFIIGESAGKADTMRMSVQSPLGTLTLAPASRVVNVSQTAQLAVTAIGTAGDTLVGTPITWSSSNAGVASVSGTGLVTGVAQGLATIYAVSGTKTDSAFIAVASPTSSPVMTSLPASGGRLDAAIGQKFSVPVVADLSRVSPNGDLGSAQFNVKFDAAVLQLDSATVIGGGLGNLSSAGTYSFAYAGTNPLGTSTPTMVTVFFTVLPAATVGAETKVHVFEPVPMSNTSFADYASSKILAGRVRIK